MDDRKFDTITQALATDGSRRRVLGALVGGVAALAGVATLEAKRGGKGKARGRGKGGGRGNGGNGNGNGNGGNGDNGGNGGNGQGRGRTKVFVCHRNGNDEFHLIRVGAPAVPAHERHGDVICEALDCQVVTGCEVDAETGDAACIFEADASAAGDECVAEDGATGTCDAEGTCVVEDSDEG
jgi:hypothetical protein